MSLINLLEVADTSLRVVEEALRQRVENEILDFKEMFFNPLKEDIHCFSEIVKDITAFYNNRGGYIIFGIDNKYNIVGDDSTLVLDSKKINDQLEKYIKPNPIRISLSNHRYKDRNIAIIYIPPKNRDDLPVMFSRDAPQKRNEKSTFRKGEIYFRKGDECIPIEYNNIKEIYDKRHLISEDQGEIRYLTIGLNKLIEPDYDKYVGREKYKDELLEYLDPEHISMIVNVGGVGGVGKSALATWATWQAKEKSWYDIIISISAKDRELTYSGIRGVKRKLYSYEDLLKEILHVLGENYEENTKIDDLENKLYAWMEIGTMLLFIDNFETIEDERISNFIQRKFIQKRASRHKILITSRTSVFQGEFPVKLEEFNYEEFKQLYIHLATILNEEKLLDLSDDQKAKIYELSGGLPLGIKYLIGRLHYKKDLSILDENNANKEDLLVFCFKGMFNNIPEDSRYVLFTLSLVGTPMELFDLVRMSNLNSEKMGKVIRDLMDIMLIRDYKDESLSGIKYTILPITRNFVLSELKINPKYKDVEKEILSRASNDEHLVNIRSFARRYKAIKLRDNSDAFNRVIEYCVQAIDYAKKNMYAQARNIYTHAVDTAKQQDEAGLALYEHALFENELESYYEADKLYERAFMSTEDRKMAMIIINSWVDMYIKLSDFRTALKVISKIEDYSENDLYILKKIGYLQSRSGLYGSAEITFQKLINKTEKGSDIYLAANNNRIHNFYKMGRMSEARKLMIEMLRDYPRNKDFSRTNSVLMLVK